METTVVAALERVDYLTNTKNFFKEVQVQVGKALDH